MRSDWDRVGLPGRETLEALEPGEGAVVRVDGETLLIEGPAVADLSPRQIPVSADSSTLTRT